MMKYAGITQRLSGLGNAKWKIHLLAKELVAAGQDIIELTIGEPDVPTPEPLIEATYRAMKNGRTGYSDGRGEEGLRQALATRYTRKVGRQINADQVMCFPGTQTALYAVLMGIVETGDQVLVGDPMYATYAGVIRASGAEILPVPLRPENGFRISPVDIAQHITPQTKAILLTSPHNPTGAILTAGDLDKIGQLALENDLWIIADEVYDELIFDGSVFHSPLAIPELADRVIVVSSISKSHAAPGFRSGWCIAPSEFTDALLPLAETMLFGNQPFIADMTEAAINEGSTVAKGMCTRFAARTKLLQNRLGRETDLIVHAPQAGMFAMINVRSTGMNGEDYALHLLKKGGVAVMPGSSFGDTMNDWVRIALTVDDDLFASACDRIIAFTNQQVEAA